MQVSKSFDDVPEGHVCFGYVSGIFGVKGVSLAGPSHKSQFNASGLRDGFGFGI